MEQLRVFLIWWRDQLLELLPGHVERRQSRAADGVILGDLGAGGHESDGSVAVTERRGGVDMPLGRFDLRPAALEPVRVNAERNRLPVVLRLPDQFLLERDVSLPIAAERDLGGVLFHEMDRFTPFAASEVLWTYTLGERDRAKGRLTARLSLVQAALAAPVIAALAQGGLPVRFLELAAPNGERRRIPLDRAGRDAAAGDRLLRPALAGIGVLLLVEIAMPFLQQSRAFALVERRIAADAPLVAKVRQLRAAAAAGSTGSEVVAAERRHAGDALEAIALLTAALPDDTYLTALTFDAGKLTMDGQSKSAAALIAPLTANRRLQNASFTAPVVRNTLGLDSFSMRLEVTR
jgi:general secretion pathway protein L